jgi:hypothetical protein
LAKTIGQPIGVHCQAKKLALLEPSTYSGEVYRLVGFDTPERADNARCDD